ncbi:transmembrane protein 186 [Dermacentor albipictus]|uniref:transmembrane protein 186 n=1 Tax=Dermacentor albipictus TaxID=60249 RepID=UPI0031FCBDFF
MASRLAFLPRTLRSLQRSLSSAPTVAGAVRSSCLLSSPTPSSLLRTNPVACIVTSRRFLQNETSPPKAATQAFEDGEWTTIFRYPHIRLIQLLCRFKIYQCVATLVVAPPLLFSEYLHWMPSYANAMLLSVTMSATIVLFLTGYLSERVVGMMYVNKDCTKLRVARMNFWGRRQDHVYDVSDIAHLSDTGQIRSSWYIQLHRYSAPNDPFFVSLKHGGIVDKELFTKVFGREVA